MPATATSPARERIIREADKLIRTISLIPQPMTRESFAPFGEIISERGGVELNVGTGPASISVQTVEARPMTFDFLGRHRLTEQVFSPLGAGQTIFAVALSNIDNPDVPDSRKMAAFIIDGSCAFKLHCGTWHTSAFPMADKATFLVIDREGTLEDDFDLRDLKTTLGVIVEIRP
ncbi:MAG: ureidoglycolate lyase [Blastocatellia bacterium]